jgi:hypothetical protein
VTVWEGLDATRDPAQLLLWLVASVLFAGGVAFTIWICVNNRRKDG